MSASCASPSHRVWASHAGPARKDQPSCSAGPGSAPQAAECRYEGLVSLGFGPVHRGLPQGGGELAAKILEFFGVFGALPPLPFRGELGPRAKVASPASGLISEAPEMSITMLAARAPYPAVCVRYHFLLSSFAEDRCRKLHGGSGGRMPTDEQSGVRQKARKSASNKLALLGPE